MHSLVLLDKATKNRLQFNLRNQSKPRELQQLCWYINKDRLKVLGENNKREIAHLCSVEAKKLLKDNLACVEGCYSWKVSQDPKEIPQPVEIKKPDIVQPNITTKNSSNPVDEKKDIFFDEDFEGPAQRKTSEKPKSAQDQADKTKIEAKVV